MECRTFLRAHFPSRTFPPNPNYKPNSNSNPNLNTNSTNPHPNPTDPTLTLLTPLLTLTLTEQGRGGMSERGIVQRKLSVSLGMRPLYELGAL